MGIKNKIFILTIFLCILTIQANASKVSSSVEDITLTMKAGEHKVLPIEVETDVNLELEFSASDNLKEAKLLYVTDLNKTKFNLHLLPLRNSTETRYNGTFYIIVTKKGMALSATYSQAVIKIPVDITIDGITDKDETIKIKDAEEFKEVALSFESTLLFLMFVMFLVIIMIRSYKKIKVNDKNE